MPARPVRLRKLAAADLDHAIDYSIRETGDEVALRFVDAIERAVAQIGRSPQSGSLYFSYELEIPGLRARQLARFPYLVFYVVGDDFVDVWRILHDRRDILPAIGDERT